MDLSLNKQFQKIFHPTKTQQIQSPKIKAVIFDMDGTILECELSNRDSVQNAAGEKFQIDWKQCAGRKEEVIHQWLKAKFNQFTKPVDEFVAACKQGYIDRKAQLKARKGVPEMLEHFRKAEIPMAVFTNTGHDLAVEKMTLTGLHDYMKFILGADQVEAAGKKAKPSGDGYRMAAEMLGVPIENCAGFEDSGTGMESLVDSKIGTIIHIHDYEMAPDKRAHRLVDGRNPEQLIQVARSLSLDL